MKLLTLMHSPRTRLHILLALATVFLATTPAFSLADPAVVAEQVNQCFHQPVCVEMPCPNTQPVVSKFRRQFGGTMAINGK